MCLTRNLNICVTRVNRSTTPVGAVVSGCRCARCSRKRGPLCRIPDPDQSGRIVLQGLVAAPRIIRLGENCPRGEEPGL